MKQSAPTLESTSNIAAAEEQTLDAFRRWGYLQADLDPLKQYLSPQPVAELEADNETSGIARRWYSGTIGVEFMHIGDSAKRSWIQQRIEMEPPALDRGRILDLLTRADVFEQVIQSRYLGTKRFSLEGVTALIPFLEQLLSDAAEHGAEQTLMGMSHRGRLNVMVHTVGKSPEDIFTKFEDVDPRSSLGGGDVKYHVGATGLFPARNGSTVEMHLVSNPSHLEAVDPVVIGRARAKQTRLGREGRDKILPVIIHGDAAFAGQGIWAETMNLATISGYSVGGTIQVIVNNLIGFTAEPKECNSSRFASDLSKRLEIPIFHVNAEDPEAVCRVAALALEYRYTFHSDVVVDLIGYRRHGHSEVDDPTVTQPLRYAKIKDHPPLSEIYARQLGVDFFAETAKAVQQEFVNAQQKGAAVTHVPTLAHLPGYWDAYSGGRHKADLEVETGLSADRIRELSAGLTSYPESFHIHPKIKKLLEQRAEMGRNERPIDYGMAEALAFGSLVTQGTPIRLSGQDSQRGTFNQRHAVLIDIENEQRHLPLAHLSPDQAPFEVYNSMLSEAGVLGFEYGFSRDYPETLTLWEAQFGDFANGAQIVIDQFIAAGEDKWGLLSGIVLLLPHGYEGQGPEHSSARVERYLQLAAHHNIQVTQPSTAAQYFHLLRRQAMRRWRKPLIVFTPKSMLRNPAASSAIEDFSRPHFQNVLPDTEIKNAKRIIFCTGKIAHELRAQRKKHDDQTTAIATLEQVYPWPEAEIAQQIETHSSAREIVWVQEEPANMGALSFVTHRLARLGHGRPVLSIKRSAAASPATGSAKAHEMEQKTLINIALGNLRGVGEAKHIEPVPAPNGDGHPTSIEAIRVN